MPLSQQAPRGVSLLSGSRLALLAVAIFSALVNILYLTGSFYMLQVYDRVIPSRSYETLIALSLLAGGLFAIQGILDAYRSRILVRVGRAIDERLSPHVFGLIGNLPLQGRADAAMQPSRDLDNIRSFFASGGPNAFFDLPWVPFYVAVCFLFHPLIGLLALAGCVILALVTGVAELTTKGATAQAATYGAARANLAEAARRNAEAVRALGMNTRLMHLWSQAGEQHLDGHQKASDIAGGFTSLSKCLRMAIQSAALGVGAFLVINGQATGGLIIAGSILAARAIAPIELLIAHYKGFVTARQSWTRLSGFLKLEAPHLSAPLALPKPTQRLKVEELSVAPPGSTRLVVRGVSFTVEAGDGLGVIGPSGSGKSTLARALVGVWAPARGNVRLDGAALNQWPPDELGRHVGYLPQDIELFDATIAQNIARLDPEASNDAVLRAAQLAGVHDMIVHLAEGYETRLGSGGLALSGGQRQRIGLARALYGSPFLLVLDEPSSNLDASGEQALTTAITQFRKEGGIAIVIAHRPSALAAVDKVLVLADGELKAFGPKEQVLRPLSSTPHVQGVVAKRESAV